MHANRVSSHFEQKTALDDFSAYSHRVEWAKQRASVTWIIQKAHKNKVPGEFQEPYYKDYDGQDHLKPNIVHRLANADFYCSALANIYGDPNFHNLSHWNIIQALARKGVYVAEPTDVALTETVLIQTTPLKISAHLAVIEAMITLYVREVVVADRVVDAVQRIAGHGVDLPVPQDQEEALVLWIDHATQNLQTRIHQQVNGSSEKEQLPVFPKIQDLGDLIDGIGLAALVSYYCPLELPWEEIAVADPPSMADSLYNIGLIIRFCQDSLPYNPCLLTKEDIVYMHSAVKQNILGFVAELFFLLELEPVSCVSLTPMKTATKYIQLSSPGGYSYRGNNSGWSGYHKSAKVIPDLRQSSLSINSPVSSSYSAPSSSYGHQRSSCPSYRDCGRSSDSNHSQLRRQHSLTDRSRNRRSYVYDESKAAGAPSVRRSHSINLNEPPELKSRPIENKQDAIQPSYQGDTYSRGRESSLSDGPEEFIVQKARGYATLSDMMRQTPQRQTSEVSTYNSRAVGKELYNSDTQEDDLCESGLIRSGSFHGSNQELTALPAAGLPSRLEGRPHGRSRSRRNSINADESQLTIENFGGSQDNLNYAGRNPDKESYIHIGRKDTSWNPADYRRSSSQTRERSVERKINLFGTSMEEFDTGYSDRPDTAEKDNDDYTKSVRHVDRLERNNGEKDHSAYLQHARLKHDYADSTSSSDVSIDTDRNKATNFAEMSKIKDQLSSGINIIYMQPDKEEPPPKLVNKPAEKKATFATLPNQTTWKQQSVQSHMGDGRNVICDENMEPQVMTSELHDVRLKLEEKRRRIETDKRKMEMKMNKQMQKLGKEAFMQAVVKGDLGTEVSNVSKKWLQSGPPEELRTPDIDAMDYNDCQNSLSQMTDSLTDIQNDIQMLTQKQNQIQNLMHNGVPVASSMPPQNQFYLHDQQDGSNRRMWGQQPGSEGYSSMSPATRRPQWGPPARPMLQQGDFVMGQPPGYYPYQMPRNPSQQSHQLPPLNQMGHLAHNPGGFILHQHQSLPPGHQQGMYQNGQEYYNPEQYRVNQNTGYNNSSRGMQNQPNNVPFRLHSDGASHDTMAPYSIHVNSQNAQVSQNTTRPQQKSPSPSRQVSHAPVEAPSPDDMEPQKIGFIESDDQSRMPERLKKLSIRSGSKTYRIPNDPGSPTRPIIGTKTYRVPTKRGVPVYDDLNLPQPSYKERSLSPNIPKPQEEDLGIVTEPLQDGLKADKGFYITFEDDAAPKRQKPQLRPKRMSLRKSSAPVAPTTTPIQDEPPPIPERSKRTGSSFSNPRSLLASNPPPPYSNPSASTISQSDITPSSSVSSVTSSIRARENYWPPQRLQQNSSRGSLKEIKAYGVSRFNETDDDSDLTESDTITNQSKRRGDASSGVSLVIGDELVNENSDISEMEKKKERLMIMSMKRKQQQEETKRKKEFEAELIREQEKEKTEAKRRKKDEEKARREMILERHKIKKAIEEADKEGRYYSPPSWYYENGSGTNTPSSKSSLRLRRGPSKPRPKTMHEASINGSEKGFPSRGQRGSTHNISESKNNEYSKKPERRWGSSISLSRATGNRGSTGSLRQDSVGSSFNRSYDRGHVGRRPTSTIGEPMRKRREAYGSRDGMQKAMYEVHEARRPSLAIDPSRAAQRRSRSGSTVYGDTGNRKYRSTGNLYGSEHDSMLYHMSEDSGLGRATPPRRAPSPGMARHFPSPSGPGSLPPGLFARRRPGAFDDNASDISASSSNMDYAGPKLFKQPTAKSNRPIILNAVEYCVFPGVVNQNAKQRVMEEIARAECKHFLVLFRDCGCQFRAIYSYHPDTEEVYKLYGTGPKLVTDRMFDKFFKYNSGGKCFSEIHTKHLTVTIDAFTIHNSLWQGKRVNLPLKKDMKIVI